MPIETVKTSLKIRRDIWHSAKVHATANGMGLDGYVNAALLAFMPSGPIKADPDKVIRNPLLPGNELPFLVTLKAPTPSRRLGYRAKLDKRRKEEAKKGGKA